MQFQKKPSNKQLLAGKRLVVAVSGGIAAYKAADLVSQLKKAGSVVHVIMTESAKEFITTTTLSTLSGNPVLDNLFDKPGQVSHIDIATQADGMVIAPATANVIGKISHGIADDFLSTMILAVRCPILVAPAMNTLMYTNSIVQENISLLQDRGFKIVQPSSGQLACGTQGVGRLAPVEDIIAALTDQLLVKTDLAGKKVLVTAGGTREPIDPVRYIGNHSSGKMGYAVADEAARRGADVVLVHANTSLPLPAGVRGVAVTTAAEMHQAVMAEYKSVHVVIKAAAVADYKPAIAAGEKIKKQSAAMAVELVPTVDILAQLGQQKESQLLVGFAAETNDLLNNAQKKMQRKKLDLIVANDVSRSDIGFASDDNQVTILYADGNRENLDKMSKKSVAKTIMDRVLKLLNQDI